MKKHGIKGYLGLSLLAALLLAACGGDGGGGIPVTPAPTVPGSYSGLTTPAAIDADNAIPIVGGAWTGAVMARDIGDVVPTPLAAEGTGTPFASGLPTLVKSLEEVVSRILPVAPTQVQPLVLIGGSCGGTADVTGTVDPLTGIFSGAATFSDYCDLGMTLNGGILFSGVSDQNLGLITQLNLLFLNLSASDGIDIWSFTEGSITYVLAADFASETDTLNLVIRDDLLQKSYWLRNYLIKITYGVPDQATLSGRYYDPDYGYCDITTLVTIDVPDTTLPTAGVLLFTGDASHARFTFNADQSTLLEVDANNDGVFETSIPNPF